MMRRTLTISALVGTALVGSFAVGARLNRGCDTPDACFDDIASTACETISREKVGNTAVRQRSKVNPNREKPAGVGDWVFLAACGDQIANVRFDGSTFTL